MIGWAPGSFVPLPVRTKSPQKIAHTILYHGAIDDCGGRAAVWRVHGVCICPLRIEKPLFGRDFQIAAKRKKQPEQCTVKPLPPHHIDAWDRLPPSWPPHRMDPNTPAFRETIGSLEACAPARQPHLNSLANDHLPSLAPRNKIKMHKPTVPPYDIFCRRAARAHQGTRTCNAR